MRDTPNDDLGIGGQSSGYWTGPVWPWSNNHSEGPGYEPDPGCPEPGCLFHLPSDPEERHECGAQFPAKLQELVARLKALDQRLEKELVATADPRVGKDPDVFDHYPSYSDPGFGRPEGF